MPRPRLSDDLLLDRIGGVFRTFGFDGASLTALAGASGLQRSSLYHRFPDGKAQMASEVARHVGERTIAEALAPIDVPEPTAADVAEVGRRLASFYESGAKACLLETLSLQSNDDGADVVVRSLADAAERWTNAFAHVARTQGATHDEARRRAEDAIAAIEGALVLARVTGNTAPFTRAIDRLPTLLLEPGTSHTTRKRRSER